MPTSSEDFFEDNSFNSDEEYFQSSFAELGPVKTSWRIRTAKRLVAILIASLVVPISSIVFIPEASASGGFTTIFSTPVLTPSGFNVTVLNYGSAIAANWTFTTGSVAAGTVTTGSASADGKTIELRISGISVGSTAGVNSANKTGGTSTVGTQLNAGPIGATKLSAGSVLGASSGVAFTTQPVVRFQNSAGSSVSTGSSVTAAITAGSGGALSSGSGGALSGTLTAAGSAGVATFTNLMITGATGVYTITYSSGSLTVATGKVTLSAGTANKLSNTVLVGTASSGSAFSTQPKITIQDSSGNTITAGSSGLTITAAITSGSGGALSSGSGGTLTGTLTAAGSAGVATFTNLGITGATGVYTITFSANGVSAVTQNVTLSAGAATQISMSVQPSSSITNGSNVGATTAVLVRDSGGNAISGATATVTVSGGSAVFGGTKSQVTNASGIATFNDLTLTGATGTYTLTFASGSLSVNSTTITLTASAATQISMSVQPSASITNGSNAGATYTASTVDITLTAVWKAVPLRTITYSLNGGTGTLPTQIALAEGATFTLADDAGITKSANTFSSWLIGAITYAPGASFKVGTTNITITAQWSAVPPKAVTYALGNGAGTIPTETPKASGAKFTLDLGDGLTRTGFSLTSWNDGAKNYAPGATYVMGNVAVTFTAVWTPAVLRSVTYQLGQGAVGTTPTQIATANGDTFTLASGSGFSKVGFTFIGWNDGATSFTPSALYTMGQQAVVFTAQWIVTAPRTVTYFLDGGAGIAPIQPSVPSGTTFTLSTGGGISKVGFSLGGWTDGSVTYLPGAIYTVGATNITLTAIWSQAVSRTITYLAGTGTGKVPTQAPVVEGQTFKLASSAGLTRAGASFLGWSNGTTTYLAGGQYKVGPANVTLTAIWSK
ncbi:MAG: carboxypeptidase regulatory-like domain-containing protein [Actinomycetales bacterium]|nr:MAG: carboxypeptidase regulatory-like domain-containing protein [Actinomycetales bacterium]